MGDQRYQTPVRDEKREASRAKILAAVGNLLTESPDEDLSFDAIAAAAGVSRRTVLNHFPDKARLFEAFWQWANDRLELHQWPRTTQELVSLPPDSFDAFDRIEGIVRAIQSSRSGREMRLMVNHERREAYFGALPRSMRDTDPDRAREIAAVIQVLSSPHVWIALKDYWGMDGRDAGEAVSWAIEILLNGPKIAPTKGNHDA